MRYTVLGANGFIGRHVSQRLIQEGHDVLAIARNFDDMEGEDLGNVIYAIGLTADFRERPFETIHSHVSIISEVLERQNFKSLVYLSSTRVYGDQLDTNEDCSLSVSPSDASDLYNLSKLTGEAICLNSCRKNVRVARLANVVGRCEANCDTFVGALCREAANGHIQLQTALTSSKDYIWIDDAVDLILKIVSSGRSSIYNVASGAQIQHSSWVHAIANSTGCTFAVNADAPNVHFSQVAIDRIEHEFGFRAVNALEYIQSIVGDVRQ